MVMYTHQFGGVSGGLSVLVAEKQIYPVWERGGSLGDLWVKAETEFVVNSTFQVHVFFSSSTFIYFDHRLILPFPFYVCFFLFLGCVAILQILFVAAIRDQAYGGIAVDDITLSPECRLSNCELLYLLF